MGLLPQLDPNGTLKIVPLIPVCSVMEPIVALGADGVEPLGGKPAEASTPSPAIKEVW